MTKLLEVLLWIFAGCTGLVIGSFLNVCIYRIPKKIFFKENRSYCPQCHTTLKWYELIPVFSYIFLRGKCRTCKAKISPRYPLIESLNCAMYLLIFGVCGISVNTILFMVLASSLIVLSLIDFDTMEIPDGIHILIAILGLATMLMSIFTKTETVWWEHLVGAVCVSGFLFIVYLISGGGIGFGDIKLMAAAGFLLGYKLIIVAAVVGIIVGGLAGIFLLVFKKKSGKAQMPLGPSLAIGIMTAALFGNVMLNFYLGKAF